ncbi:MAG TPA: O-antigen ligase family protein [Candidatus Paceibacterota bacterium]|nr:O-antigen ligase family protein [Candidatus Paceibacterota bacterium]
MKKISGSAKDPVVQSVQVLKYHTCILPSKTPARKVGEDRDGAALTRIFSSERFGAIIFSMNLENTLKWILYTGLFAVLLIPLLVFSNFFFPYITGKAFVFRILVEVLFVVWVLLALRNPMYRPKWSGVFLALVFYIFIMFLAGMFGENPVRSFWSNYERMIGVITYLHLLVYFLIVGSVFRTPKIWHTFFASSLAISIVVGIKGLLQISPQVTRVSGTLGNPIYLAIYSLFHIFLAAYLFANARKRGYDTSLLWFYGIAGIFNVIVLYFTGTRGSILGLLGGIFVIMLLLALFERKRQMLRKIAIGICIFFVALPLLFFAFRHTAFIQGNPTLSRFTDISLTGGGGEARYMLWGMSLDGFKEHPILGWGPENFPILFTKYYTPDMYSQEAWFDRAHSMIFDELSSAGILGVLGYLSVFLFALFSLWNFRRLKAFGMKFVPSRFKQEQEKREGAEDKKGETKNTSAPQSVVSENSEYEGFSFLEKSILTGLLAAYFIHNLFVFENLCSLILFAFLLAFIHERASRNSVSFFGEKSVGNFSRGAWVGVVGILVVVGIYEANYLPMMQNLTLSRALSASDAGLRLDLFKKALAYNTFGNEETREQIVETATSLDPTKIQSPVVQQYFTLAASEIQKSEKERPEAARSYFFESSLYAHYGELDKALSTINKALALSPLKQQFLNMKTMYLFGLNKYDDAIQNAKMTYLEAPGDQDSTKLYAAALIYEKQTKEAEDLLTQAFGTSAVPDTSIINAYAHIKDYPALINLWKARVAQNPDDVQSQMSLIYAYYKNGDNSDAIAGLKALAQAHPELQKQIDQYITDIQNGRDPATAQAS